MIREARHEELEQILELYLHLHETSVPEQTEHLHVRGSRLCQTRITI